MGKDWLGLTEIYRDLVRSLDFIPNVEIEIYVRLPSFIK